MEKFSKRFTNLNRVSKIILKYGLFIVLVALVISNMLLKSANSISTLNLAREFACGSIYACCEVIMGAIMIDMLIEKNDR